MNPQGVSLFVSDLHLSPDRPETLSLALSFLAGRAREADRLYLLGDIFDAWIGDDDDSSPNAEVKAALAAVTASGVRCHLMHGNRDFLIGRAFCRETGCRLLRDPTLARFGGESTLLMHGDLLCTDDVAYQRFRRRIRNPLVQRLFLWRSLAARRKVAADYRRKSGAATAEKAPQIMDVNQETVARYLRRYGAVRLIHGHTHRPGDHLIAIDGREAVRSVLAEWHPNQGEMLVHEPSGWHREPVLPSQSHNLQGRHREPSVTGSSPIPSATRSSTVTKL
ncbi:UDP-2,3-diacylglucosamine hydrolase [Thiocapsa sp. KS1]|nr:UDP-2,3-diacylglucosamine diphosphatase [Thiocapsa sp. KS1]CRI66086.1 UDP-2,3-diacylglucosamine hydrolase [Thiocapsa sp. KS1]